MCGGAEVWLRMWVFFFQAEDGIRDVAVTGVQTCALPICRSIQPTIARRCELPGNSGHCQAVDAHGCLTAGARRHDGSTTRRKSIGCHAARSRVALQFEFTPKDVVSSRRRVVV